MSVPTTHTFPSAASRPELELLVKRFEDAWDKVENTALRKWQRPS
jgi:hypothetical protein